MSAEKTREQWSWSKVDEAARCPDCQHSILDHGCHFIHVRLGMAVTSACSVEGCTCGGEEKRMQDNMDSGTVTFRKVTR